MLKKKYTKLMKCLLLCENHSVEILRLPPHIYESNPIELASKENRRKNIIKHVISKILICISMHVTKC